MVIVGSGIAGLSVAYELSQVGQTVVVLDRGPIAGGMTSRTTAHLAPVCDDGVGELTKIRGEEMAREVSSQPERGRRPHRGDRQEAQHRLRLPQA